MPSYSGTPSTTCPLCTQTGGTLLWQSTDMRIIQVDDPDYPGFCRVIWNAHVREMSDLLPAQQHILMTAVFAVEAALREVCQPDKINLASLGNRVDHLHWHVIPRWHHDRHFPEAIWGAPQRTPAQPIPGVESSTLQAALHTYMAATNT